MLNNLAPHSRVWIFQANRILSESEIQFITEKMNAFIPTWASHGNELYGAFEVQYNLFIVVGVDEQRSPTSGCSIDTLTRVIKEIGTSLNVDFFDRLKVAYRDQEQHIHILPLHEFKALMKKDTVRQSTPVFNNLIETKEELETKWQTTVKNSWHKNLLEIL